MLSSGSSPFAGGRHKRGRLLPALVAPQGGFNTPPRAPRGGLAQAGRPLPSSPASSRRPPAPGSACPGRASSPPPASCYSRSAPGSGPCPSPFSSSCGQRAVTAAHPAVPSSLRPPKPFPRRPLTACRPPEPHRCPSASAARAAPPRSPPWRSRPRSTAAPPGGARRRCRGNGASSSLREGKPLRDEAAPPPREESREIRAAPKKKQNPKPNPNPKTPVPALPAHLVPRRTERF